MACCWMSLYLSELQQLPVIIDIRHQMHLWVKVLLLVDHAQVVKAQVSDIHPGTVEWNHYFFFSLAVGLFLHQTFEGKSSWFVIKNRHLPSERKSSEVLWSSVANGANKNIKSTQSNKKNISSPVQWSIHFLYPLFYLTKLKSFFFYHLRALFTIVSITVKWH